MGNLDQEIRIDLDKLLVWTVFEDKVIVQVVVVQLIGFLDVHLKSFGLMMRLVLMGNGTRVLRIKLFFLWNCSLIKAQIIINRGFWLYFLLDATFWFISLLNIKRTSFYQLKLMVKTLIDWFRRWFIKLIFSNYDYFLLIGRLLLIDDIKIGFLLFVREKWWPLTLFNIL